ncbi:MAG TPA: TetR family transcriptional regulator [Actinomycetes bacterium]|nr:TetR family transcriptional regulator [Actinomycetes bacterium]
MFSKRDLTARALIRNEALRLFARDGPDAVTVRQIAAAAAVSPALVLHHYGSKEGLRAAVDEHVTEVFDALFAEFSGDDPARLGELLATGSGASLAELLLRNLPPDSPIPAYLRRLLLAGDRAGTVMVRRWFQASQAMLRPLIAAGVVRPGRDPEMRTAILMANDLAMLLLRDQLAAVLGTDPLEPAGMTRWAEELLAIYREGLFATGKEELS